MLLTVNKQVKNVSGGYCGAENLASQSFWSILHCFFLLNPIKATRHILTDYKTESM